MMRDRQMEFLFGAVLLTVVILAFGGLEILVRLKNAPLESLGGQESRNAVSEAEYQMDWVDLHANATLPWNTVGLQLYRPHAQWRHLVFNEFGFRGPDIVTPKPDGTYRLAFIGDSTMLSASFSEESTIPSRTARILNDIGGGCSFDYVNFSGSMYSSDVIFQRWPEVQDVINPDLVVLHLDIERAAREHLTRVDVTSPQPDLVAEWLRGSRVLQAIEKRLVKVPEALNLTESGDLSLPFAALDRFEADTLTRLRGLFGDRRVLVLAYHKAVWAMPSRLEGRSLTALQEFADANGWFYTDPFSSFRPERGIYHDGTHFGPSGLALISEHLARDIARIAGNCFAEAPKGAFQTNYGATDETR